MNSLIAPDDTWLLWSCMLALAAFGVWSDSRWLGKLLSGAVVTLLAGILFSTIGFLPAASPAYGVVYDYLLPLAIPLILFQADLGQILRESGRVLLGFVAGAIGTVCGAVLAFGMIPLGEQASQYAASLTGAYIGGTVNLAAVGKAVGLEADSTLAAIVAAGNLTVVLYLVPLFLLHRVTLLARWLPRGLVVDATREASPPIAFRTDSLVYALAISVAICALGFAVQEQTNWSGTGILTITLVSVALATAFPQFFAKLEIASAIGFVLLHVVFAAIGASANVLTMLEFGPILMAFAALMLVVHLAFVLLSARLFALSVDEALIASNACALGAPTAAAMALSFKRPDLVLPALLSGIFGYAIGNFAGLALYALLP
ncbi:MAG: DUF819 family protein [Pseudomonadota bacterium]